MAKMRNIFVSLFRSCSLGLRTNHWKSRLIGEVVLDPRRYKHGLQVAGVETLQAEPLPGGLEREVQQRPGLGPVGGQRGAHLGADLASVGGEEAALGEDGGQHVLPHEAGLRGHAEHLAHQLQRPAGPGHALGADHRTKKNTKG